MARPIRIKFENAWYHVMNRGAGKKSVFCNDVQRTYFIELLAQLSEEFEIEIHAYCLMGNHYHLLLRTPKNTLSEGMKYLGSNYTKYFNYVQKTDGALFRGRFKAIVIDADAYLVQVSRYIHRNPVEAALVDLAERYPWSSYAAYLNPQDAPGWLQTHDVLSRIASSDQIAAYRDFVGNPNLPSFAEFYNSPQIPGVLGSKSFRHYVSALGFKDVMARNEKPNEQKIESILDTVAEVFNCQKQVLRQPRPGLSNLARLVALQVSYQSSGQTIEEISKVFGMKRTACSTVLSRFRRRLQEDEQLRTEVDRVVNLLSLTPSSYRG